VTLDNPAFNLNTSVSDQLYYAVPELTITQAFAVNVDNTSYSLSPNHAILALVNFSSPASSLALSSS